VKVKVSLILDIPDKYADDGLPKSDPLTPSGTPWADAFIRQGVFDNFTNYANCQHLQDALKWVCEPKSVTQQYIVDTHKEWAEILNKGNRNCQVEILSEKDGKEQIAARFAAMGFSEKDLVTLGYVEEKELYKSSREC